MNGLTKVGVGVGLLSILTATGTLAESSDPHKIERGTLSITVPFSDDDDSSLRLAFDFLDTRAFDDSVNLNAFAPVTVGVGGGVPAKGWLIGTGFRPNPQGSLIDPEASESGVL
jgi:hypothetical protein